MHNFFRSGLFVFLLSMSVIVAFADPARVVSKQENLPDVGSTLKTRIFLDITPNDGNDRADAYVDLFNVDSIMSAQEFSEMIQVGDILEFYSGLPLRKDGRFTVITFRELLELNGVNIYKLFIEELGDINRAKIFTQSMLAYNRQNGN
jgi:hypothetical protein